MANILGLITVNGKEWLEVDADPAAGGGTVVRDFPDDSILQAGTANGEYFDVILTNLDAKDATGYVTFYYTEE